LRFVQSADRGSIWIPSLVRAVDQLMDTVAARALAACAGDHRVRSEAELIAGVRSEVAAARHRLGFTCLPQDHRWRPLWLTLMARHPLRPQFRFQRQLRSRGHVVLGYVVFAGGRLDGTFPAAAPALVLFSTDPAGDGLGPLGETVATIVNAHGEGEGETDEIEAFRTALGRNAGFPLWAKLPASLSGRDDVYCTSLMIAGRDLPLGQLCARWLPLLIDPTCRYTIVVPMRLWGTAARRQWKAELTTVSTRSSLP